MAWQTPVFDRTDDDVAAGADKCYFTADMLNRIEGNVAYLAQIFGVALNTKTDWLATDFLTPVQMQRILDNVDALRAAYFAMPGAPALPGLPATIYSDVNAIEELLWGMRALWDSNKASRYHTGQIKTGQKIGVL